MPAILEGLPVIAICSRSPSDPEVDVRGFEAGHSRAIRTPLLDWPIEIDGAMIFGGLDTGTCWRAFEPGLLSHKQAGFIRNAPLSAPPAREAEGTRHG